MAASSLGPTSSSPQRPATGMKVRKGFGLSGLDLKIEMFTLIRIVLKRDYNMIIGGTIIPIQEC